METTSQERLITTGHKCPKCKVYLIHDLDCFDNHIGTDGRTYYGAQCPVCNYMYILKQEC